jgi:hypothetical protein
LNLDNKKSDLDNIFEQLDSDKDGHISFEVVDKTYCEKMKNAQKSFFRQVKLKKKLIKLVGMGSTL